MAKKEISRRDFIKGVAAGAVGVAAMGVLPGCGDYVLQNSKAAEAAARAAEDIIREGVEKAMSKHNYSPEDEEKKARKAAEKAARRAEYEARKAAEKEARKAEAEAKAAAENAAGNAEEAAESAAEKAEAQVNTEASDPEM